MLFEVFERLISYLLEIIYYLISLLYNKPL